MTRKQKQVKEWIAARIAKGQSISKSVRTYAQNVGIAMELALPPCEPTKSSPERASSRRITETSTGALIGYGNDDNCEFNIPDEERFYPLSYYPCPICRSPALLWRTQGDARKPRFQVMCQRKACGHKTGWHKSSAEATRIWKLTSVLTND